MEGIGQTGRKTMRAYWFATGLVVLIAFMGAATIIWRDYRGRIDDAGEHAMNLVQALSEHTTQIIVKLDALSRAIIEDSSDRIVSDTLLSEVLRRRAAAEPAAKGIVLVDAQGRVFASGIDSYPVGKDFRASAAFRVLSGKDAPQYYISRPHQLAGAIASQSMGWTMNYARRIETPDGRFGGYVLIIVDDVYLYGFYRKLDEEAGRVIGIVGEDGIIRASSVSEVIGWNIKPLLPVDMPDGRDIRIDPSVRTGIERIFAFASSSAAPLMAYVGLPTAPIKKAWWIATSVILLALLALLAALIALGIILGKYMRGQQRLFTAAIEAAHEKQEKEFLETIVNTGEVLLAVTDSSGLFLVANKAFQQLFPLTESSVSKANTLSRVLGAEIPKFDGDQPWREVRSVKLDNGQNRLLSWSVSAIRTHDNQIKNLVALGLDVTDRRAAELALYQSSKLVNLGEMATGIAHEINQPLNMLALGVDHLHARIVASKANLDDVLVDLEQFSSQIERTATIVRHMRIYGRKSDGSLQAVDPFEAISGALTMARAQIEAQGINVEVDCKQGDYLVVGDLLLIEQILLNLFLNARDAILEKNPPNSA